MVVYGILFGIAMPQHYIHNLARSNCDRWGHYEQKNNIQVYSQVLHRTSEQVHRAPVTHSRKHRQVHKAIENWNACRFERSSFAKISLMI